MLTEMTVYVCDLNALKTRKQNKRHGGACFLLFLLFILERAHFAQVV